MPTIRFSLFALLAALTGLACASCIFGGGPEALYGAAARAARAPERRLSKHAKAYQSEEDTKTHTHTHMPGAGHETLEFDCASRVGDAPFGQGGAPVQYIHIPKAGGSTIQNLLIAMAKQLHYRFAMGKGGFCNTGQGSFGKGQVYMGHKPLGWCFAESPVRPLYIISLREPISLIVSLYDFMATQTFDTGPDGRIQANPGYVRQVRAVQNAEKRMEQQGIPRTEFLEHLFNAHDHVADSVVKASQIQWLAPTKQCSKHGLSIALKNLLRCDIVVDTFHLSDQLLPQLWYHSRQARYLENNATDTVDGNVRKRSKQVLSKATVAKLLAAHRSDTILYDFAVKVARAREDRARACWDAEAAGGAGRNGVDCSALCAINVTATESELLRSASPSKQCSGPR